MKEYSLQKIPDLKKSSIIVLPTGTENLLSWFHTRSLAFEFLKSALTLHWSSLCICANASLSVN